MEANPATPVPNLRMVNAYARAIPGASRPVFEPPRAIGPADADKVELSASRSPAALAKARSLVAASVPESVDFQGAPRAADSSLAFYRHPADANAAATGVAVGRTLDVQG